ncbi:MAG: DUF2304 domain-containing protein [Candidatus Uhrbacteria bacterium]
MIQLLVAILVIIFFITKLCWQKRQGVVSTGEFVFWLIFWLATLVLVLFLKQLDRLVASLGFSVPAIQVVAYLAIAVLFYFIFRVRLKLEKMEENLSKINEEVTKRLKK